MTDAEAMTDADSARGALMIADRVIEKIASQAVTEVDRASGASRRVLGVSVGGGGDRPRVHARVDGATATVEVSMSVLWPAPVLEVAREVRAHVQERLLTLAAVDSAEVDIEVSSLYDPRSTQQSRVR